LASRRAPQSSLEARGIGAAPLRSLPRLSTDIAIIDILDPLAHETAVAITAFIVDRPQP